ncbi:MAG: malate synthase A [Candidatus Obscuribacterales bacterium]|nr:malate synthase A [Candidatus Obscuribacterales bacterium]
MKTTLERVEILGKKTEEFSEILTDDALNFLFELDQAFAQKRESLLLARSHRKTRLDNGEVPDFLKETESIRSSDWRVASCPADLEDRRVEITGPVDAKMIINALNCGANLFMADFEDANSPTWSNCIEGQINLKAAVRRTLSFQSAEGKTYNLNEKLATLKVRPRGLHLLEKHLQIDGKPISASLFDFGLFFFHNAQELLSRGSGPYFYIPKLESHHEARFFAEVFKFAEDYLKIKAGSIRCTVLIETILAAFEMDEILYELKDYASGLNAGRWDYMFSMIKKLNKRPEFMLPDRALVTMNVPFMRSYCDLLVKTCHRRHAHAMGGMAAFIPSRKDKELNAKAMSKVAEDKQREAGQGFDGTWIAHPDLLAVAKAEFDKVLGNNPNQKTVLRQNVKVSALDLLNAEVDGAQISEAGLRNNINVALQYLDNWLRGIGAAAIFNLMEDAATAEISRAQIWLWLNRSVKLSDGRIVDRELYKLLREEELAKLKSNSEGRLEEAAGILDDLIFAESFPEFLTLSAYELLD